MNNELYHFNHKHDKLGRFTFSNGGSLASNIEKRVRKKHDEEYKKAIKDNENRYKKAAEGKYNWNDNKHPLIDTIASGLNWAASEKNIQIAKKVIPNVLEVIKNDKVDNNKISSVGKRAVSGIKAAFWASTLILPAAMAYDVTRGIAESRIYRPKRSKVLEEYVVKQ